MCKRVLKSLIFTILALFILFNSWIVFTPPLFNCDLKTYDMNEGIKLQKRSTFTVYFNRKIPASKIEKNVPSNAYFFVRTYVGFNLKMFILIALAAFLFSFKIFGDFKAENFKKSDLIFVSIFFVLIFIPMFNVNFLEKSSKENRILAKFPAFCKTKGNFAEEFENAMSDRFFIRDFLYDIFCNFKYQISSRYYVSKRGYLDKKTNWEFNFPLKQREINQNDINEISKRLNEFNDFCKKNKIKFYVLVVPSKEDVYSKKTYLKTFEHKDNIKEIAKLTEMPVIYPYQEMIKGKDEDFVFFKGDHHWTDWGAYTGYEALTDKICEDFSDLRKMNLKDYNIETNKLVRADWERSYLDGHTNTRILNLPKHAILKVSDVDYKYYNHKKEKELKIQTFDSSKIKERHYLYPSSGRKAVILGTSMCENLNGFLPYSFNKTLYFRLNNIKNVSFDDEFKILKRLKDRILDFKPDVLIICVEEGSINFLKKITNED